MKARYWVSQETSPIVNLSRDHLLLDLSSRKAQDGIIRFWRNSKSIILGRLQEYEAEVNSQYCLENEIPVYRRVSGGGAVFHDLGNLNISVTFPIHTIPTSKNVIEFSKFYTMMIANSLTAYGFDEINIYKDTNITYKAKKISGSAGHLTRGWFLYHATLLVSSDLQMLENSLLAKEKEPEDRRRSRYHPTTNLDTFEFDKWKMTFLSLLEEKHEIQIEASEITESESQMATEYEELYRSYEWIVFGKRKFPTVNWDEY